MKILKAHKLFSGFIDGFVSRAYIPSEKHMQTDGDFGVIIAATN